MCTFIYIRSSHLGCSMQAEDLVTITAWKVSISLSVPQLRLMEVLSNFQFRNRQQSQLGEVSSHFLSRNLSQSRLMEISSVLYPRPPIAKAMRLRVLLDATWLCQQGIRIHRFPLSCLSSSLVHSLYCILVHWLHRLHNRFSPLSIPLCTIHIYSH